MEKPRHILCPGPYDVLNRTGSLSGRSNPDSGYAARGSAAFTQTEGPDCLPVVIFLFHRLHHDHRHQSLRHDRHHRSRLHG